MSNMKVTIWFGWEAGNWGGMFPTLQIVGDDFPDKVFFLFAHELLNL
jgi:hypothetical protein